MHNKAFTLIELLIVVSVIAVMSTAVIVILNPAQHLKQARDVKRMTDFNNLDQSLKLAELDNVDMGTANIVYVSLPDSSSDCSSLSLPSLSGGYTYHCSNTSNYRKVDGTGWIPVNLSSISSGSPLAILPIDAKNTTPYYYTYSYSTGGLRELNTYFESEKYLSGGSNGLANKDGGDSSTLYEVGTDLTLSPLSEFTVTPWACGDTLTDSRDGKTYNTVLIGTQCWMAEHINIGTLITGDSADNGIIEKYCFSNTESYCTSDGGLYQWDEAMQYAASCDGTGAPPNDTCATPVQGICPSGWHIPSHYEYTTLEKNVGSNPGAFPYDETTTGWLGTDEGTKDRKSTRLNSSHIPLSRMPSSA